MKASIGRNNSSKKNNRLLTWTLALLLSMFFTCLSTAPAFAAAPQYEWTKTMGGSGFDHSGAVAVDISGNVYISGRFESTVDFDPGVGFDTHTPSGFTDIFLTRINADGSYGWTKTIGGTGTDLVIFGSMVLDANANIYITGGFTGTVDFDPGTGVDSHTASAGGREIYLTRINSDGSYAWTKILGGSGVWHSISMAIDGYANIYVTGSFEGTVDFDPGAGVDNHTATGYAMFGDIFLTRINADGSYAWTKTIGGGTGNWASSVAIDGSGNIFLTGGFKGTVDFDPGVGVDSHTSAGSYHIYLSRINADGSYAWTKTMVGTQCESYALAVDVNGNIYMTGYYEGTVDFDPGAGVDSRTSAGLYDIFLTRINADGSYGWTKTMGGTGTDYGLSVTTDASGNIYSTGTFSGTFDFDPGAGADIHTSAGQSGFLTRINSDGSYAWTKDNGYMALSVTVDASWNIYVTGIFYGTADFDPGPGVDNHTSVGVGDIFLTKFSQNRDDLLVDFGSAGLYARYNDSTWTKLHNLSPTLIATGELNNGSGKYEAIAAFSPYGLYARYDNAGPWTRLHSLVPDIIATGDMDGGGADEIIAVFPTFGIYARYNAPTKWERLTNLVPEQVIMADLDGDGHDDLVCDFGAMGIWAKYNNGAWTKIIGANPALMAAGDIDGGGMDELIAYFPAFGGIWTKVNNSGWTKLHALAPESIVTADLDGTGKDEVIVDFGVHGIWAKYDNTTWTKLHALSPDSMTTGDLDGSGRYDLVADFGVFGIYARYDDSAWTRIHTGNPEIMSTGNLDGN